MKSEQLRNDLKRIQSDIAHLSGKTKEQDAIIASLDAEKASLAASITSLQAAEAGT